MSTLLEGAAPHPDGHREIDSADLAEAMREGMPEGTALIDVRVAFEFDGELGHIPGSTLMPLAEWPAAAKRLSREDEIVLVCRTGNRSAKAAAMLLAGGFRRVMLL